MSKGICTRSHSSTSRAAAPHPVTTDCLAEVERRLTAELAAAQKHANDLGDLLAKVEERVEHALEVCQHLRDRDGDKIWPSDVEQIRAILEGDTE